MQINHPQNLLYMDAPKDADEKNLKVLTSSTKPEAKGNLV